MNLLHWHWQPLGREFHAYPTSDAPIVWQIDLDAVDPAHDAQMVTLLSSEELSRLERLRFEKDQRWYLRSRAALRMILSQFCNMPPKEIEIGRRNGGKPYIANSERSLEFNLSHSENRMLLGLHTRGPIGVDLEKLNPDIDVGKLASYVLTAREALFVQSQPLDHQHAVFLRYWVAKEALLKATGEGLGRSMTDLEIDLSHSGPQVLQLADASGSCWLLESWSEEEMVAACVTAAI